MNLRMANERQVPRGYTRNMVWWYNSDTPRCMLEHPKLLYLLCALANSAASSDITAMEAWLKVAISASVSLTSLSLDGFLEVGKISRAGEKS